jgi:NTE family protein
MKKTTISSGSKLSFDLILGDYSRAKVSYSLHSAWGSPFAETHILQPRGIGLLPDMELELEANNFEIYQYQDHMRTSVLQYTQTKTGLGFNSNLRNDLFLGLGANLEFSSVRTKISGTDKSMPVDYNTFLNLHGVFRADNQDDATYPTRGVKFLGRVEYLTNLRENSPEISSFVRLIGRFNAAIPAGEKLTLIPSLMAGHLIGDSVAQEYYIYCGGLNQSSANPGYFTFPGKQLLEEKSTSALIAGLDLQYRFLPSHYLRFSANLGKFPENELLNFWKSTPVSGFGLTYGYNSIIGPVEFTLMKSPENPSLLTYLNLGFWF